ncbi:MAG: DUF6335 family protein [Candidatus Polarisedimenticolia bacterium]
MASRKEKPAEDAAATDQAPPVPVEEEVSEVDEEFQEAGKLGMPERAFKQKLRQHYPDSPKITAGDVDAAWDRSDVGEETPGGSVATPDQDIVEQIGEAIGQTFEDNEPLDRPEKLERRGGPRWELDPASSEDYQERHGSPHIPRKR